MSTDTPARFADAFGDWTPRAVVFDCDGLLLDTETVWQAAEDAVVTAHGAVLSTADRSALHGATIEVAATIVSDRSGSDYQDVLADLHREFDVALGPGIRTMPGAAAMVARAAARVPLACASNSWLSSLDEKLRAGGLREHFRVLEASDTVASPKPAPDMYAAAARALGTAPEHTLALEDSGTGARSALGAGLRLIAVPAPGTSIPGSDLVLESLEDPELLDWISTW